MSLKIIFMGKPVDTDITSGYFSGSELYNIVSKKLGIDSSLLKLSRVDEICDIINEDETPTLVETVSVKVDDPYVEYLNDNFEKDESKKLIIYPDGSVKKQGRFLADEYTKLIYKLNETGSMELIQKIKKIMYFGIDMNMELEE